MECLDPQAYRQPLRQPGPVHPLAIIIHVYYPELFRDMLDRLQGFDPDQCKLFVSTTPEHLDPVKAMLESSGYRYHLAAFANRGRDILPFLKLSEMAIEQGYPLLLKLHSKKHDRRSSGSSWRKDLYDKLLNKDVMKRIMQLMVSNPEVGLIGPIGHIVPLRLYYGSNALDIAYLSYRLGIESQKLREVCFIAGSMFYIRALALKPFIDLKLSDELFEEERGQRDGTMAHAVERVIAVSSHIAGFQMADTSSKPNDPKLIITGNHRFTW